MYKKHGWGQWISPWIWIDIVVKCGSELDGRWATHQSPWAVSKTLFNVGKKMQQTSTNHPPVITIFKGDINKSFPVMAGKNGIVLPTWIPTKFYCLVNGCIPHGCSSSVGFEADNGLGVGVRRGHHPAHLHLRINESIGHHDMIGPISEVSLWVVWKYGTPKSMG